MPQSTSSQAGATPGDHTLHVGDILDDTGERIRREAEEFLNLAKDRGKSIINEQLACVAKEVSQVAEVVQHAATELSEKDSQFASHYAKRAASGLSDFSGVLRDNDVDGLVLSAERCAARSPGVFLGISVGAGFLLGRFLLSSAQHPKEEPSPAGQSNGGLAGQSRTGAPKEDTQPWEYRKP